MQGAFESICGAGLRGTSRQTGHDGRSPVGALPCGVRVVTGAPGRKASSTARRPASKDLSTLSDVALAPMMAHGSGARLRYLLSGAARSCARHAGQGNVTRSPLPFLIAFSLPRSHRSRCYISHLYDSPLQGLGPFSSREAADTARCSRKHPWPHGMRILRSFPSTTALRQFAPQSFGHRVPSSSLRFLKSARSTRVNIRLRDRRSPLLTSKFSFPRSFPRHAWPWRLANPPPLFEYCPLISPISDCALESHQGPSRRLSSSLPAYYDRNMP